MKKRILSLLLVVVLDVSLCACNGPATNDPSGDSGNVGSESGGENNPMLFEVPEGGYDGSEVTISFHHTLSSRYWSLLDTYIAEFNKLYPNIHVEHQLVGDYEDIYESTMKIGLEKGPNVVYCDLENVANYRLKEYVVALDNLIKHSEVGYSQDQLNDFVDAIALFIITYCAIPIIVFLIVIWFIKFLFNITIPIPAKGNMKMLNIKKNRKMLEEKENE